VNEFCKRQLLEDKTGSVLMFGVVSSKHSLFWTLMEVDISVHLNFSKHLMLSVVYHFCD